MSWLYEQQLPTVVISLCIAAASVTLFFRSRRPFFLWGILGAALFLGLGLWIEWAVVTEEEEIENTLIAVAAAMEQGDMETVFNHIDSSGISAWRSRAITRTDFKNMDFANVSVSIERIDISRSSSPVLARVRIFGKASGAYVLDGQGGLPRVANNSTDFNLMGRVVFGMYKGDDGWIIQKVERFEQ